MKVMVIGAGGREHAIVQKLKENPEITKLYALPGNGGIAKDAVCVPIGAKDLDAHGSVCQRSMPSTSAVVAPDDPLVLGGGGPAGGGGDRLLWAQSQRRHHRGQQGLCQGPDETAMASPPPSTSRL